MKIIGHLIIFFFLNVTFLHSEEIKLTKITEGLKSPWSLSFINQNEVLITEKSGNIIYFHLEEGKLKNIKHNLKILEKGQGGLLDILYHNKKVFVSYSENRGDWKSSTSIAKGKFNNNRAQGIVIEFLADFDSQFDFNRVDKKNYSIVILDSIKDPQNLGQIMRTCECAGVDSIVLPSNRSISITDTVLQASQGAFTNVENIY